MTLTSDQIQNRVDAMKRASRTNKDKTEKEKVSLLLFFRKFFTYFTVVFFGVITTERLLQPYETYTHRNIVSLALVVLCICVLFSELTQIKNVEAIFLISLSILTAIDFVLACLTLTSQDELIRASYYLVVSANFASLGFDRLCDVKKVNEAIAIKKARQK
jgi:hypothetical protein